MSEACQLFLVPSRSSNTPLYPSKCCELKERASTPPSFAVFYLDSHLSPLKSWECVTWYQSSGKARSTYWGILMAPKKTRKVVQKTVVEEPTQDPNVPPQAMKGEEQKDFEGEGDRDSHEDHESEEEQSNAVFFTPEQLKVLLKMNRPNFNELVTALKGGSSKGVEFKPARPGNFDGAWDRKVVDAWLVEMEDYFHAAKVSRHSAVELTQSYLKGYASTWRRTVRQEEGKTHGYTWEFFKEHIKLELIPKNYDYISRCKLHDLVIANNDNLHQCVRAYSELMLEIRHMHELDRACHFVMGLPTWAKRKLEENWLASLTEAIMKMEASQMWGKVRSLNSKGIASSLIRRHAMKGNGTEAKTPQRGKSPNNSKVRVLNPREILRRKGLLSKGANPREMLMGNLREHVSIAMKWAITPRIAPNPNWGMGLLR